MLFRCTRAKLPIGNIFANCFNVLGMIIEGVFLQCNHV
jgi:hypothetical protein